MYKSVSENCQPKRIVISLDKKIPVKSILTSRILPQARFLFLNTRAAREIWRARSRCAALLTKESSLAVRKLRKTGGRRIPAWRRPTCFVHPFARPSIHPSIRPSVARLRPSWHRCSFNSALFSPSLFRSDLGRSSFCFKVVSLSLSLSLSLSRGRVLRVHYGAPPGPRAGACVRKKRTHGAPVKMTDRQRVTKRQPWKNGRISWPPGGNVRAPFGALLRRGSIERSMCAQAPIRKGIIRRRAEISLPGARLTAWNGVVRYRGPAITGN